MVKAWGTRDSRFDETESMKNRDAGWTVDDGREKGVRVAPWVVKEQKKYLSTV